MSMTSANIHTKKLYQETEEIYMIPPPQKKKSKNKTHTKKGTVELNSDKDILTHIMKIWTCEKD